MDVFDRSDRHWGRDREPGSPGSLPSRGGGGEASPHFVIACRLWNGIANADVEALKAVLSPKTVWRVHGRSPLAGTYIGVDAALGFMAEVGERSDELRADLVDILVSERGAVLHYAIEAQRGPHVLQIEHLLLTRIERGKIVEAVFAPLDQEKYDRFWLAE
jgi:ketosteroid isomerase-like protein